MKIEQNTFACYEKLVGKKVKIVCKKGFDVVGKVLAAKDSEKGLARIDIEQGFYKALGVDKVTRESALAVASVYLKNIIRVEVL